MNFEKTINDVAHLHTERHAHIVYGLIRWLKCRHVLEIGAFAGYLSAWISKALDDNGLPDSKLYIIDDFSLGNNNPANITNVLAALNIQTPVFIYPCKSQELEWPFDLDLIVIDGDHSYEGCKSDFIRAVQRTPQCIILHDTISWWGPRKLIEEDLTEIYEICNSPKYDMINVNFDCGLAVFIRSDPKPPTEFTEGKGVKEKKRK